MLSLLCCGKTGAGCGRLGGGRRGCGAGENSNELSACATDTGSDCWCSGVDNDGEANSRVENFAGVIAAGGSAPVAGGSAPGARVGPNDVRGSVKHQSKAMGITAKCMQCIKLNQTVHAFG